ncbi:hypothetical protein KJZ61_00410 [Candidatus Dependentiae bacterium]|nr:hypothetical protein [Candidatus Dependentiae bacterium]
MIYGRVTLAVLMCGLSLKILCGIEGGKSDAFLAMKSRARSADKIRSSIDKLSFEGYLDTINQDQLDSLIPVIEKNWDKIVKPGLGQHYVTLSELFGALDRFEDDERRNYEHVETSEFKKCARALSAIVVKLARMQSKTSNSTNSTSKMNIPDGGVFEIEL